MKGDLGLARVEEYMVLVEYQDRGEIVTGWDIWRDGRPIADFHVEDGDTYEDAYNYASEMGFERLPEPVVEDWNNPVWQAYSAPFDTDAGIGYVLDVFDTVED